LSATSTSKPTKPANNINHVIVLLDMSSSMRTLTQQVVKVTDSQIQSLAERSKFHDQETRISLYTYTHHGYGGSDIKCLIWDKDVLRVPSIAGLYHPDGWTPLADAMHVAIGDARQIPEMHGDHSHLLYLFTDGFENKSKIDNVIGLPSLVREVEALGNWTIAAFAPNIISRNHMTSQLGFHKDNILIWDPDAEHGVEEVGEAMSASLDSYMGQRSRGMRSTTSLFAMKTPDITQVKGALTPMTPGSYFFEQVTQPDLDVITCGKQGGRIDEFMQLKSGVPYTADGRTHYEMVKRERVQHYKRVAVAVPDHRKRTVAVYTGKNARQLLGLPAEESGTEVRVSPGRWKDKGYKVYIGTTSLNRQLPAGTSVLVLR
jgi:hypothetical protein